MFINFPEYIVSFQILAVSNDQFSHLFGLDDEALEKQGVQRKVVDCSPGFPCRVSLQDAEVGESVLLMNYEHHPVSSPFRSSHAIFVRESAVEANLKANEIPAMFKHRLLSVRAFDAKGMMIDADVVEGEGLEPLIEHFFANESAKYLHIHNARLGCYAARVERC
jgi:hypothetical protein